MPDTGIKEYHSDIRLKDDKIRVFDTTEDMGSHIRQTVIKGKDTMENPEQENKKPEEYAEEQMKESGIKAAETAADRIRKVLGEEETEQMFHPLPDTEEAAAEKAVESIPKTDAAENNPKTAGGRISPSYRLQDSDSVPKQQINFQNQPKSAVVENLPKNQGTNTLKGTNPAPQGDNSIPVFSGPSIRTREPISIKEYHASIKQADKGIRTSQAAEKAMVATGKALSAEETAKAATRRAAEAAGRTAAKESVKASAASAKTGAVAAESAGEGAAAGGWMGIIVAAAVIFILTIVANIAGAYLTGQMDEAARPMHEVVMEINREYNDRIMELRNERDYDTITMTGTKSKWRDVLAVYFAKTMDDPEESGSLSFFYITKEGEDKLRDIFWDMNDIGSRVTRRKVKELVRAEDDDGNIVYEPQMVTKVELTITVSSKTAYEISEQILYMNNSQKEQLYDLLSGDYDELWSQLIYGYMPEDCPIVEVALQEVGNIGGEKYWRWYGFGSHVDWCACFVSWCANECGYIEEDTVPKYSSCAVGVQWFKDHGQWLDASEEPEPGMIIFFDWNHPDGQSGPQNGVADHTGIVERVEDNVIYTIEGNAWDVCMENQYPVGHYEILGYGVYETEASNE